MIETYGYQRASSGSGWSRAASCSCLAWFMRAPSQAKFRARAGAQSGAVGDVAITPGEVLKTPVFWLLYVMFVMVSASGLMATAQIAPIAKDFGVGEQWCLLFGGTTLTVALIVDNVANGAARPLFGWMSDHIGREYTMAIAFALGGVALLAARLARHSAVGVRAVRRADLPHLGRDLQPVSVDLHRHVRAEIRHRESQPALHRQGHVGLPGAAGNMIKDATGGWQMVFLVTTLMNFVVVAPGAVRAQAMRSKMMAQG